MKKSLVIISFAFIFLLSMSIVSANFFDWLNGDVAVTVGGGAGLETKRTSGSDGTSLRDRVAFLRQPVNENSRTSLRQSGSSSTSFCPRGWTQIFYSLNGKENKCCVPRPK